MGMAKVTNMKNILDPQNSRGGGHVPPLPLSYLGAVDYTLYTGNWHLLMVRDYRIFGHLNLAH